MSWYRPVKQKKPDKVTQLLMEGYHRDPDGNYRKRVLFSQRIGGKLYTREEEVVRNHRGKLLRIEKVLDS